MSSENEECVSQRRDFHPTGTPVRVSSVPVNVGVNLASGRPTRQPPSTSSSNPGPSRASEPQNHDGESEHATYKRRIRSLELQLQSLREESAFLTTLLPKNRFEVPTPEVARWEMVKPQMPAIAKRLLLGLDPKKNRPFPREEHIKEAILEVFNTPGSDTVTRKRFNRAWVETLRTKVKTMISNTRGRLTTNTRTTLWRQLGVPKPQRYEEIAAWKETLEPFMEGNRWRWNGDDPFGSDALCNTIAIVKTGRRYSPHKPLQLTAKQLAWFAYVMHLAMDGDRNMKESEMRLHKIQIKDMKKFILESRHLLTKIELIVSQDVDTAQEVLDEDLDDE